MPNYAVAGTPRYPSGTNTFIPQATGQAIAYVRDPAKFKINQYVQGVKADKPVFAYAFLDPDAPVRLVTDEEFDWPDGNPRPRPAANIANFKWLYATCVRRDYGWTLGEQAVETADGFNPKAFQNAIILSLAMTNRTFRFITLMETASQWGTNTADANSLNGGRGKWDKASDDESSPYYLAIKRTLLEVARQINLATNGMVGDDDPMSEMSLILSPATALAIAETSEIHNYIKQSPVALAQVKGDAPGQNKKWGLPDYLYGFKIIVESAPRVKNRIKDASGTVSTLDTDKVYMKSATSAVVCCRPGGLDGNYGSPSFSTFQRYYYKYDLQVEARKVDWDKLYEAHIVDQFIEVLAAPQSGYLITNVL